MAVSAFTDAFIVDIEHDVIWPGRVAGNAADGWAGRTNAHMVETQVVADKPGDVVIGAGGIAADAEPAHEDVAGPIKGQAAAKDVDAANLLAGHRIVKEAIAGRWTRVSHT